MLLSCESSTHVAFALFEFFVARHGEVVVDLGEEEVAEDLDGMRYQLLESIFDVDFLPILAAISLAAPLIFESRWWCVCSYRDLDGGLLCSCHSIQNRSA